jgi:hypothetical protein
VAKGRANGQRMVVCRLAGIAYDSATPCVLGFCQRLAAVVLYGSRSFSALNYMCVRHIPWREKQVKDVELPGIVNSCQRKAGREQEGDGPGGG